MKQIRRRHSAPRRQAGFTIVETMIVLAIAGMILIIVFEAIPQLERSSRNNQRRQDVQTVLSAVSHWELNHSANIPDWKPPTDLTDNFLRCPSPPNPRQTPYPPCSVLKYYTSDEITVTAHNPYNQGGDGSTYSTAPITNQATTETVQVYNHAKCDSNNDGSATPVGASYTDIVALYALEENNGGKMSQCQQL